MSKAKAPDRSALLEEAKLEEALAKRRRFFALDFVKPYPKQLAFHALTATRHEAALIAANRSGKSYVAAEAVARHLTGIYPKGWPGKIFDKPTHWWAAGATGLTVRDTNQRLLFGRPNVAEDQGTGMVPKSKIVSAVAAHGYGGLYDTAQVKHKSGGISTVRFMTYEQGRVKWQAETLDGIWCDEEPPMDIYSEGLTRLGTTSGIMLCTFTPLEGMSEVVIRYMSEPSPDRGWVGMTLDEAEHIAPEERELIIARYPEHEREARSKGVPMLGSGKIFKIADSAIAEPAIQNVPPFWAMGIGMDFGIDHPFAAVLMAWDRESKCVHVLGAIKMKGARPIDHAAAMKPWGQVRAFWPHDGSARDKGSGETLASIYKSHGVKMYGTHAHFKDGSISTEAAIMELDQMMQSGQFKVASHLEDVFAELRMYHRKDGQIVKQNDDLISAIFKGVMMLRHFEARSTEESRQRSGGTGMCRDVDFDVFDIAA